MILTHHFLYFYFLKSNIFKTLIFFVLFLGVFSYLYMYIYFFVMISLVYEQFYNLRSMYILFIKIKIWRLHAQPCAAVFKSSRYPPMMRWGGLIWRAQLLFFFLSLIFIHTSSKFQSNYLIYYLLISVFLITICFI